GRSWRSREAGKSKTMAPSRAAGSRAGKGVGMNLETRTQGGQNSAETSGERRILLVEDEALVAMLLEEIMADLGYQVVGPVGRLAEAIELAKRAEIDGAILDVTLAGHHVYDVAATLDARGIPFMFATGYGQSGLRDDYIGRPVLNKPFRANDLKVGLER